MLTTKMKLKLVLTTTTLLFIVLTSSAQKINIEKTFGGYKFTQNGKALKMNELAAKVSANSEARKFMQSAKSNIGMSTVLGGAGGFLIGWPIGSAIGGGEPNWLLAAGGVVLVGVSLPLSNSGYKKARKAVNIYNQQLEDPSGSKFKPQFELAASAQGIGLLVKF